MRLIHTSDVHIASPLTTRLDPIRARERGREIIESFRRLTLFAQSEGCEGVIISGDLFDNERVSRSTLDTVVSFFERTPAVNYYYLPGNHEKNALLSSGISLPENLKIFGEGWTYFELGDTVICGRCATEKNMFDTLTLDKDRKNILALHGELSDRSAEGGKIGTAELAELPVDYVALGHYHTYGATKISDRCEAVYSGTPEGRGFDEAGDKGFVMLEVDGFGITHRFLSRAKRLLHIVEVDITDAMREVDIENRILEKIGKIPKEDLIRVNLTGYHRADTPRDTQALTQRICTPYYFLEVKDKSHLKISLDDYRHDKSLKGEFIRLVLSKQELSDEEKERIIECGISALAGELKV